MKAKSKFVLPGSLLAFCLAAAGGCAALGGAAPTGSEAKIDDEEAARIKAVSAKVKGRIVWSSSRLGNHDLFAMDTDGSKLKQLTKGDLVDWFPRYSPDGKQILFVRSKKGWVSERDANTDGKWDIFLMPGDGAASRPRRWRTPAGGPGCPTTRSSSCAAPASTARSWAASEETLLVDSEQVPDLDGALLQQPQMSRDGKFIAITLRGSKRETGIWDVGGRPGPAPATAAKSTGRPTGKRSTGSIPRARAIAASSGPRRRGRPGRGDPRRPEDLHRSAGRPLARILPGALGRRGVPRVGRHQTRARPRHRRLRDLPVAGGQPARSGRPADLPLRQRPLARHLRARRRRPGGGHHPLSAGSAGSTSADR